MCRDRADISAEMDEIGPRSGQYRLDIWDYSTFHGVLTAKFRPDPNEGGSAVGLTHNLQNQR